MSNDNKNKSLGRIIKQQRLMKGLALHEQGSAVNNDA